MKTWKFLCLMGVAGCVYTAPLHAEPLKISPYPVGESVAPAKPQPLKQAPPPMPSQDMALEQDNMMAPVVSEPLMAPLPELPEAREVQMGAPIKIEVPQPGDSYFDPPGAQPKIARAAPTPEPVDPKPEEPEPTIIAAAPESVDVAPIVNAQEEGNLRMRMSESFDGMVVDTAPGQEVYVAGDSAPPPPFVEERMQEAAPMSEGEKIAWYAEPVPVRSVAPPVEPRVQNSAPSTGNWKALEGENIEQVLVKWASDAGVVLLWEDSSSFAVLAPLEVRGNFEQAVQQLLDQYQNNQVRPLATLHIDPDTHEKTMVVRVQDGV